MPLPAHLPDLLVHDDGETVDSPEEWSVRRAQILDAISSIIGVPPSNDIALDAQTHSAQRCDNYQRLRVSFQTEDDERVPAWLLVPHEWDEPGPAVLCLHQTVDCGKDEPVGLGDSVQLAYAHELASTGYVTLAPDHLCAGERIKEGLDPYDTSKFYEKHPDWSAVGKAVWDGSRALDYMHTLTGLINSEAIGCIGHSLGGHSAVFLSAMDNRIAATVSNCGLTTFQDDPNRLNWARDSWYRYMSRLRPYFEDGARAPFDMHDLAALVAPRPLLNISALNDKCFADTEALADLGVQVHRVYRLLDAAEGFSNHLHGMGHGFPNELRGYAYGWLDRWLKDDDVWPLRDGEA